MTDTVFRTKTIITPAKAAAQTKQEAPEDKGVPRGVTEYEPPFTEYQNQYNKPFLVDHYELGRFWDQGDMYSDAYKNEVDTINKYLGKAIDSGEVNNTVESVKKELKRIEKLINVRPDQRKSMRIGLVAEYAHFLLKSENIKKESAKYGMI